MKIPSIPSESNGKIHLLPFVKSVLQYLRSSKITSVIGGRLKETPNGTTIIIDKPKRQFFHDSQPPFWSQLYTIRDGESRSYQVSAKEGFIHEIRLMDTTPGATKQHAISNQTTANKDTQLTIANDQSIFVKYNVAITGEIDVTSPPIYVVDSSTIESDRYYPAVGDYAGLVGVMYREIARLEIEDDIATFTRILTGHILHIAERSAFANIGGGVGLIKDYDPATDTVNVYSVDGKGGTDEQIQVGLSGGKVIVEGNGKDSDILITLGGDEYTIDFKDGLNTETGQTRIDIPPVGNGIDGSLQFLDEEENELGLVEWVNGLVTTAENIVIVIPSSGGGS